MSRFSGKCDLYDDVELISCDTPEEIQEYINNAEFYIWNHGRRVKIDIKTRKDLGLYYPYLVSMGCHSNGKHIITLSSDSFIDTEEAEILNSRLKEVIRYYNKCKRDKVKFDVDEYIKQGFYRTNDKCTRELAKRVKEFGKKATIEGLHTNMHEHYRNEWYECLVKELGWDIVTAYNWVYKSIFSTKEERAKRTKVWKEKLSEETKSS